MHIDKVHETMIKCHMEERINKKVPFYKSKALFRKFVFLYIFKFFLFGYLFILGCIVIGILFHILFSSFNGFIKYLQFFWTIPFLYCFIRFIIILSTTNYKWRFFRISHYRLSTRRYSEDYFKYEIFEPCTRMIVKNILYEYDLRGEYELLKKKYLKINQRIEDEKIRLLSHVVRKNEKNKLQEVAYGNSLQG